MLVQIFASSACTGVVRSMREPNTSNRRATRSVDSLVDAADDVRQRRDLLDEVVLGDALGRVRDEHVAADLEAALLLDVAGDELGRAGRDGRAQHDVMAGAQERQQRVERRADVGDVDLDVREARRAEREHDVARLGRVLDPLGELQPVAGQHALEQLLRAALLERHHAGAHGRDDARGRGRRRSSRGRGRRSSARAAARRGRGRRRRRRV